MTTLGYARVSTQDQDLSAQLAALKKAGATTIFKEKISGVRADRPQLARMVATLKRGDLVIVTRLDRLGRSVRELLNLLAEFDKLGVGAHGRLMLTVLGGLAEFERELIRARTGEGRKRAMANGVKFGRPRALDSYQRKEAVRRRQNGESLSLIAQSYRVSAKTIARL